MKKDSKTNDNAIDFKRDEVAAQKNDQMYRMLFESSRDAIMTVEPPTWKFTSGNQSTQEMFGVKDEADFISHKPEELSPERQSDGQLSADKSQKMIEITMREGVNSFEWTHRRVNGEEFPATVLLTKMNLDGKVIIQATVRDITEAKAKEAQLVSLNEQLQIILDASPAMIFYKDKENRFIRVNEALAKANGRSKAEMEGKTCWEIYDKELADKYWQDDKDVIDSGKSKFDIVERMETPNGTMWVQTDKIIQKSSDGEVIGVIGFAIDITERKKAEEALKEKAEETEKINKLMIGRELSMMELKKENAELRKELAAKK